MLSKSDSTSSIISVQATNIWCGEKTDLCEKYFTDALNIAKVEKQDESNLSYHTLVQAPHLPHEGANDVYVKNVLLTKIDDHLLNALHTMLKSSAVMGIEVRAIDGPINQLSPDFDAWSFREATLFVAMWGDVTQSSLLNQLFKPLQDMDVVCMVLIPVIPVSQKQQKHGHVIRVNDCKRLLKNMIQNTS